MRSFKRPNVLMIYTDQQRLDSLRCYGSEYAVTPNLDKLAENGSRFNHFYTQSPICMPSRMSLFTGRYCSSLNIGDNGIPLEREDATLINEYLKPYNYDTAYIGKIHFQTHADRDHKNPYPDYGFDTFIISDEPGCYDDAYTKWVEGIAPDMLKKIRTILPPEAYKYGHENYYDKPGNTHEPYVFEGDDDLTHTSFVCSEVCNYLESRNSTKPFFLTAGFYAPHPPINPPQKFIDLYKSSDMPIPNFDTTQAFDFLKDITVEEWKEIKAYYMAMVSMVDEAVGEIINKLKEKKMLEDTLIIFTTDHGEYLGDFGKVQKGMPGNDVINRVPCLISYPNKIDQKFVVDELVEAVDILPTILDYCGVQIPKEVQGKSLKNLLSKKTDQHKEDILIERFLPFDGLKETTIRNKRYKYYCNSNDEELLFDLKIDKNELRDLSENDEYSEILSFMRKRMIIRMQEAAYTSRAKRAEY